MKGSLRLILYLLLTLFGLFVGLYFVTQNWIRNLNERSSVIKEDWSRICEVSKQREAILLKREFITTSQFDSIRFINQNTKRFEKAIEFDQTQYLINKWYFDFKSRKHHQKNPLDERTSQWLKQMSEFDKILNDLVHSYKSKVAEFNLYITMFPRSITARRNGFKRLKRITIKFGKVNEDPQKLRSKFPEWAKDVDTSFLNK